MKTLLEHFEDIRQRSEMDDSRELNMFVQEIEKSGSAAVDSVKNRLPRRIIVPYEHVEFFTEYENPPGLKFWKEAREEGFVRQPIPGFTYGTTREWYIHLSPGWWALKNAVHELPYRNEIFGKTFRLRVEDEKGKEATPHIFTPHNHPLTPEDVWALTREDLEGSHNKYLNVAPSYFAYLVGRSNHLSRPPNEGELKDLSRIPLVEHVFGISPPTDEEILETLKQIHGVPKERGWYIDWVSPEELSYPLTKGVLCVYRDAKDAGIFEGLEFGVLSDKRKAVDPVLAGKYQGFRIPLCYWI